MKKSSNSKKSIPKTFKSQIEKLKAKESALSHGMRVANVGFCYLDTNLRYIYINEWLAKINGFTVEEHIGRSLRELFPDLAEGIEPQFQKVIETGNPIIKGRVYAKTHSYPGVKRLFEHNYFADKSPDGIVQGISCFVEDISERERALEKLKESEKKFKTLVDSVRAVPWRFDLKKNRFTYIGKQVESLLGYPVSYWVDFDSWSNCIHTDDRNQAVAYCMDSTAKGLDHDFEYRCVTADGNIVWLHDVVTLKKDDTGVPFELIGYMIDITERKLLENKVSQYSSHLEKLVADRTSELQTSNLASQLQRQLLQYIVSAEDAEQALKMCLIELSEFLEYEHAEIWLIDENAKCLKAFFNWTISSKSSNPFAGRNDAHFLKQGQGLPGRVWKTRSMEWCSESMWRAEAENPCNKALQQAGIISALGVPVQTGDHLLAVFCFYSTDSKKPSKLSTELISATTLQAAIAIDRLHISTILDHVLESAPGAMLLVAMDGIITYQNRASYRLFGYDDSELLGKSIELLMPEGFRELHSWFSANLKRESLPKAMGSGLQKIGRKKNGTKIPIDVTIKIHKTLLQSQIIVGVVDLSEHELNLNRLKDYSSRLRKLTSHMTEVAERERKSIARDLHDDLGQVLTSLGIDVVILKNKLLASHDFHDAESMAEDLAAMSDTLGSASKRLHGFVSKLRPEVLDNLGLITSLKLQTEEFFKTYHIDCEFVCNLESIDMNGNVAIAIYRIAQECLTNIARHSKAEKSQLKVEVVNNSFVLEVSDDGVGISTETLKSTDRFGLMGIKERVSGLNGEVQIDSALGKGTKIRTTIPIDSGGADGD